MHGINIYEQCEDFEQMETLTGATQWIFKKFKENLYYANTMHGF